MITKVRVYTVGADIKGWGIFHDAKEISEGKNLTKVTTVKVYRLEGVKKREAKILAEKLLSEKINQKYTINEKIVNGKSQTVEIAYRPGVMNPEVASIMKASQDLGIKLLACDSSSEYVFYGPSTTSIPLSTGSLRIIKEIIYKLHLLNEVVEYIVEKEPQTLVIKGELGQTQNIPLVKMNDEDLMELSKDKLFLSLDEMRSIQNYFRKIKRDPTDCELETLAQTWSEHSGHKTFKSELLVDGKRKEPLIKRIKKEAMKHKKNIVSAFVDNSGVMDFYDGFAICGKVETHNSPSAIEPYGGAMTGSGGVFRDIAATGQGAKNIASTDIFCFAPLNLSEEDLPEGCLHPKYLLKKVVEGVRDYGNRMGIPTNNGSVHFHKDFRGKPTVIVGAYGIIPKKYAKKGTPKKSDLIMVVGGRTGRDGIHGATFSSAEMTERTINVNSAAVQIGNAIEEKRMFDALEESRDQNLIRMVQDVGGGGFSSAIGEIGEQLGVWVDIKNAPLKYQGLSPWEIWMSESQERMVVVIDPKSLKKLERVCKKYNVKTTVLGKFDGSKKLKVFYGEEKVCDLDMEFLHHGLPKKVLIARKPPSVIPAIAGIQLYNSRSELEPHSSSLSDEAKSLRVDDLRGDDSVGYPQTEQQWTFMLEKVLAHGNVCSKEPIVRLYDHSVQGTNDLQPYSGVNLDGPNDSPVLRPFLDKPYGVVISHGLNPLLSSIDPYWGSIWAATEALSNFVAVGGDYKNASLINNYIWPFPDEESLWSLDKSVDAVVAFMKAFKIPVISGKDSLSSTYRGKDGFVLKIPPVLCMSVFGKIPDVSKTVSADFKMAGSVICLVGKQDLEAMGGSTLYDVNRFLPLDYFDSVQYRFARGRNDNAHVPKVDLKLLPKVFSTIYEAINRGKVLSCHDISEGGLITAIFEMCVGGNCGAALDKIPQVRNFVKFLFNETAGCFIVEVENEEVAKQIFKNIPYKIIGKTQVEKVIEVNGLFKAKVDELKKVWQKPMKEMFA